MILFSYEFSWFSAIFWRYLDRFSSILSWEKDEVAKEMRFYTKAALASPEISLLLVQNLDK